MRQRCWLELVKGYNCTIHYHPGKVNVGNALGMKKVGQLSILRTKQKQLTKDPKNLKIKVLMPSVQTMTLIAA